jgi:hypothetical protein
MPSGILPARARFLPPAGDAPPAARMHKGEMERARLHREGSLALLLFAVAGAATALALAVLVAGAGPAVAALVFTSVLAFGLAADGRAEAVAERLHMRR